jgi:hypothetical protein
MPRDDPPEEMSVEDYLKLTTEKKPKGKKKAKQPRKKPDPPTYCETCGKRITFEHSQRNIVKNGKAYHYHLECCPEIEEFNG